MPSLTRWLERKLLAYIERQNEGMREALLSMHKVTGLPLEDDAPAVSVSPRGERVVHECPTCVVRGNVRDPARTNSPLLEGWAKVERGDDFFGPSVTGQWICRDCAAHWHYRPARDIMLLEAAEDTWYRQEAMFRAEGRRPLGLRHGYTTSQIVVECACGQLVDFNETVTYRHSHHVAYQVCPMCRKELEFVLWAPRVTMETAEWEGAKQYAERSG